MKKESCTIGQTYREYKESVTKMIMRETRDLKAMISGQSLDSDDKEELVIAVIKELLKP